jgi:hypothetical protein
LAPIELPIGGGFRRRCGNGRIRAAVMLCQVGGLENNRADDGSPKINSRCCVSRLNVDSPMPTG